MKPVEVYQQLRHENEIWQPQIKDQVNSYPNIEFPKTKHTKKHI